MGVRGAANGCSVGFSGVGLAVSFGAGSFRALHPRSRASGIRQITEWAWQLLLVVRRWYPEREIVAVADSTYASLKLLDCCRRLKKPITFITRLRLDAALYEPAPSRYPGQIGRPRLKGESLPNLSIGSRGSASVEWKSITIIGWYGGQERVVEVVSADGRLVQHWLACRAPALGIDPRP